MRKCPQCGKPVAHTLTFCNGCGRDLADVDISYTNNVFTGFAYGIEKVKYTKLLVYCLSWVFNISHTDNVLTSFAYGLEKVKRTAL